MQQIDQFCYFLIPLNFESSEPSRPSVKSHGKGQNRVSRNSPEIFTCSGKDLGWRLFAQLAVWPLGWELIPLARVALW